MNNLQVHLRENTDERWTIMHEELWDLCNNPVSSSPTTLQQNFCRASAQSPAKCVFESRWNAPFTQISAHLPSDFGHESDVTSDLWVYLLLDLHLHLVLHHVHQGVLAAGVQHPLPDGTRVQGHGVDEHCRHRHADGEGKPKRRRTFEFHRKYISDVDVDIKRKNYTE